MPVDLETLQLYFVMRNDEFIRQQAQTVRGFSGSMNAIKGEATDAVSFIERVFAGARLRMPVADMGPMAQSMNVVRAQSANLSQQFQDIAVQLQSGQSWATITLQQGTQIAAALGPGGLTGTVYGLRAAFIATAASIPTIALVGAAVAALQYLGTLIGKGEDSEETIDRQNKLIQQTAERWGSATPALREYATQLERVENVQRLLEAVQTTQARINDETAASFERLNDEFRNVAALAPQIRDPYIQLAMALRTGRAEAVDFQRVLDAIAQIQLEHGAPVLDDFRDSLTQLRDSANQARGAVGELTAEQEIAAARRPMPRQDPQILRDFIAEQQRINSLTTEQLRLEEEIAGVRRRAEDAEVQITPEAALAAAQDIIAAEERRAQIIEQRAEAEKRAQEISQAVAGVLREHADVIDEVRAGWTDAAPVLSAYVNGLNEVEQRQARLAGTVITGEAWEPVSEAIATVSAQLDIMATRAAETGDPATISRVDDLRGVFEGLKEELADGRVTAETTDRVIEALASMMSTVGVSGAAALTSAMNVLSSAINSAGVEATIAQGKFASAVAMMRTLHAAESESMRTLRQQEAAGDNFISQQRELNSLSAEELAIRTNTDSIFSSALAKGESITQEEARQLAIEQQIAEERRRAAAQSERKGRSGADKAAKELDRERQAVSDVIDELSFEYSLLGKSELQQEKMIALRRAGAAATEGQRGSIGNLVTMIYEYNAALEAEEQVMEDLKDISRDVLGGMFDDLRDGASAAEVLANALNRVGEALVTAGIENLITGAFNPRATVTTGGLLGGRIIPGFLHRGGIAGVDGYDHNRAVSPSLFIGARRYHRGGFAGINPGEVPIIAKRGEPVGMPGSVGAVSVNVNVSGARGNAEIAEMTAVGVRTGLRQYDATLADRVGQIRTGSPRRRGRL
jgi:hypothetical protein